MVGGDREGIRKTVVGGDGVSPWIARTLIVGGVEQRPELADVDSLIERRIGASAGRVRSVELKVGPPCAWLGDFGSVQIRDKTVVVFHPQQQLPMVSMAGGERNADVRGGFFTVQHPALDVV